jgi:tight adherence protein B
VEPELLDQMLLDVLGTTALLGGALLWTLRAQRRRASLEVHLKAIVRAVPTPDRTTVSLRRPLPQRRALPAMLLRRLDLALAATGNRIGLPRLAASGVTAAVVVGSAAAAAQFRPALAIAFGGAAAIGVPGLLLQLSQSQYQRRFLDVFPDALDLIVRGVRAGLPAPEAIEVATREIGPPVGTEFRRMLDEMRIGIEMEIAFRRAADRIRVPDFRFFVVSLFLQRQTGGGIAETLSNLSAIIRQRKALRLKAHALTAEATASAAIMAAAPFVAGGGLFLINRELMSILFVDPRGRFMLGLAIGCLLLGVAAMKVMIDKSLR